MAPIAKSTSASWLILSTILCCLSPWFTAHTIAKVDILDRSIRNNSTHTRTFNLERETSWSNQDFEVEEVNGTALLRVETRFDRQDAEAFQMLVTTPTQHQFTIGLESQPDINPHLEACGHKQTYRTTDRVDFECNPRIFLVDRWRIKRGAGTALTRDYIWHRKAMGLAGPIRDESGRHVAHFRARTLGQEWLAMLWHTKGSHVTTYTIETNDEIPIEYLAEFKLCHPEAYG